MSILDFDSVDGLGFEKDSGRVVMLVSDHLDWSDPAAHIQAVERKLNGYLQFVQSGQVVEEMPDALGKPLKLMVYMKHTPPDHARMSLDDMSAQLASSDIILWFGPAPEGWSQEA